MRAERCPAERLREAGARAIAGAVLLAPARCADGVIAKGTRVTDPVAARLVRAAVDGGLAPGLRLGWPEPGDLHEDDAAGALARAAAGAGVRLSDPHQSRVNLVARMDGVLRVRIEALAALNRIDPLEVFTLFHGQAVRAGQVVGSAKVAPHLVPETAVRAGVRVAEAAAPLVDVVPYLPLEVAAVAAEPLAPGALARFEGAARDKVTALGGRFAGTTMVAEPDAAVAADRLATALAALLGGGVRLLLVGGVSAGDPLSPMFDALERLGGRVLRRGVPAHPGSMIWLARLGEATMLGLPQCGMFSMATAADLVLPRLMTGEVVTADTLADLGHGGLLGREMRFRLPDYARDLDAPD